MLRLKHCHDLHLYNIFYSSTDDPAYEFKCIMNKNDFTENCYIKSISELSPFFN